MVVLLLGLTAASNKRACLITSLSESRSYVALSLGEVVDGVLPPRHGRARPRAAQRRRRGEGGKVLLATCLARTNVAGGAQLGEAELVELLPSEAAYF